LRSFKINSWFSTDLFSLNIDKALFMQFVTKNSSLIDLYNTNEKKKIANICNTIFLGIPLDNTLIWKAHIDSVIPKLSSACFLIRAVRPLFCPKNHWRWYYYSYFLVMMCAIVFWGNSYYSKNVFRLQKNYHFHSLWFATKMILN
jgi:hypothetical protein